MAWNIGGSPVQGHLPVIRSLPNVASAVGAGVTVYSRGRFCNEADTTPFLSVFTLCSHCEEVSEKYLDAFTAFSGSGIAFVSIGVCTHHLGVCTVYPSWRCTSLPFLYLQMSVILEAMADGGVLVGLPRAMAQKIAAYTMIVRW